MKFKKFFAVLSAVSMLATAAAINVSADGEAVGSDPSSRPYSFEYAPEGDGVIVTDVTVAEGIDEVEIPDEVDGKAVVGVADFAFMNANVGTIVCPDSFVLDNIGTVAFLTADDIGAFLADNGIPDEVIYADDEETLLGAIDATTAAYTANTVKFMGKKNWKGTEEELEPARTVFSNVAKTVGGETAGEFVGKLYTLEDTSAVVRAKDEDTLEKMSERSYENFQAWVKAIPVNVTIKANEGTDAQKYAEGKKLVDVKFVTKHTHLLGDANGDSIVNVRDCAKIANALAFKTVDELPCKGCADYNEDGDVTVRDAAQLANAIATGKIDTSKK